MDRQFSSIFNLTEEQCIDLLNTPQDEVQDASDRYIAASRLVNYPSQRSISALIAAVENLEPGQDNRIVRRKAVETLGYIKAELALPQLSACLRDEDSFTVDNAIWAIGEIGTDNTSTLASIASCLEREDLNHRGIVQVLAKLGYGQALSKIRELIESETPTLASAAISAVCQLTGDYSGMTEVIDMLYHPSVNARRGCIQDLIDARYYDAIPEIATSPISIAFRLRGIRQLVEQGLNSGQIAMADVAPHLDLAIQDRPHSIQMVHQYDRKPSMDFLIGELFGTDFGRCYLACKNLLDLYSDTAGLVLMTVFEERARDDYGAHYHVLKLLGWLKYQPSFALLQEELYNEQPQFRKSRIAAAIALGELADREAIPKLQAVIGTATWELDYACLLALNQLGCQASILDKFDELDFLVQARFRGRTET